MSGIPPAPAPSRSSLTTTLGANELAGHHATQDVEKNAHATRGASSHVHHGHHHHRLLKMKHLHHKPGRTEYEGDSKGPVWERYVSRAVKNNIVATISEYVGTTMFLLIAFGGTNVANIPDSSVQATEAEAINTNVNPSQLLYISLSFGFSLTVCAWIFFRVSGGLFNPAVSLALALVGAVTPGRAALLTLAQILGAITAAGLIEGLLPGPLLVKTSLNNGISIAQGLFLEMFLTSLLMLAILFLAAEKHKATFLAPVGIGLALFMAEMTGVYYTGGSLNPARSFGPDVISGAFPGYHWIYWLGPAMGAVLAAGLYKLLKALEYEDVVPDQDAGAAAAETLTDEDAEHHAQRIHAAELLTQAHLAHHQTVVANAGGQVETPHTTTENVNAARIGELSAKLDAVLSAVSAINSREREAYQTSLRQRVLSRGDSGREGL